MLEKERERKEEKKKERKKERERERERKREMSKFTFLQNASLGQFLSETWKEIELKVVDPFASFYQRIVIVKIYSYIPAPWFYLRLPYCGHGFESHAHQQRFLIRTIEIVVGI